ncbi:MAG: peptidoglycan-binding domain-containing protein, partial [Verrucomicrobia bacterium]|nr:peptidoglycan-binding domain-containing protein [Verrucomicrobiota bacterium]
SELKGNHGDKGREQPHGNPHHDHDQQAYHAHPSTKFKLNKGNGHAGQGYYYGPPNMPYYYARPGVSYYPNQRAIPPQFRNQDAYRMNSDDYRAQQALARLGYYQGPVDGQFGPQSYRALNSYQRAQGMPVSNALTAVLLRALGLQ